MRTLGQWAVLAAGIAACDAQRGPDYQGEALLTIQGSITRVDGERLDSDLIPAIAWEDQSSGTLYLQDVHAEGDFPASFRLSVLQPPPSEAIAESIDGFRFAIGYIIAARPGHPERIVGHNVELVHGEACEPDGPCMQTRQWCTWDNDCYVEELVCDSWELDDSCRVVSTQGDPALRATPWEEHVEGFSENYAVFYALDRMPSSSAAAGYYNGWKAIAPGMYLLELGDPDDATIDAVHACEDINYQRATEWYNTEHGTSFADRDELFLADLTTDDLNEFELAFLRFASEQKCSISYAERLLPRARSRPIEVVIGKRVADEP